MLFWWLTLCLAIRPLERIVLDVFTDAFDTNNSNHTSNNSNDSSRGEDSLIKDVEDVEKRKVWECHLIPGQYEFVSSSNFDEYLQELGVGFILRRLASIASPQISITHSAIKDNDDNNDHNKEDNNDFNCENYEWTIMTSTLVRSHKITFNLSSPSLDITMDGRKVLFEVKKGPISNQIIEDQTTINDANHDQSNYFNDFNDFNDFNEVRTRLVRTFSKNEMLVDLSINDVEASSVFRRVENNNERDEDSL